MASPTRPVQGIERLWLAAERIQPGFVISLVIEGDGILDLDAFAARLQDAVTTSMTFHPGFRVRLRGATRWMRGHLDGPVPAVRRVIGVDWDGLGPHDLIEAPLDPERGPAAEVVLVDGAPIRLLFRVHHAAGDARALSPWTRAVFSLLRGEIPPQAALAPPDSMLLGGHRLGAQAPWAPSPRDQPALLGECASPTLRTTWARVRVPTSPRDVLVRILVALRGLAPPDGSRVSLPIDLRAPGAPVDGNLTGIATLDLPTPEGASSAALRAALRAAVQEARDPQRCGAILRFADGLRDVPLFVLAANGRRAALDQLKAGRFESLATVSNVGRMDLSGWSGGGFRARHAWVIPPGSPGNPFFLVLAGDDDGVDLIAAAPVGLASAGRLTALLDRLAQALVADQASPGG